MRVAILTASDRCSRGEADDASGCALQSLASAEGWKVVARKCVPDEKDRIAIALLTWCDDRDDVDLILTTGNLPPLLLHVL